MSGIKRQLQSFDYVLVAMVIIVAIMGIIVLGSATRIDLNGAEGAYTKQKIWLASGLALMLLVAFVDYHFICRFYIPVYIINILLLLLLFGFSNSSRGVERWIEIGSITIQPSEFAKIFMIIFLAKFIDKENEKINNGIMFVFLLLLIALPIVLIIMQPALSASIVIFFISAVIVFAGKISYKNILFLVVIIMPIATFLYVDFTSENRILIDKVLKDYQIERIELIINPEEDPEKARQTENSIYAIGSGMLMGKGLYNGKVRQYATENDFIFSVLGEEFGFAGCAALIFLMFLIICKCLYAASKATDMCGRLLAVGVGSMLFIQTFFHVGVTIGFLPNTGVTFPFFSYGGSSMWVNMIGIGLVINVGMSKPKSMFEA